MASRPARQRRTTVYLPRPTTASGPAGALPPQWRRPLQRGPDVTASPLARTIRETDVPIGVRVWRLPQAGFVLKTADVVVVIDPYVSDWLETASPENPAPVTRARPSTLAPEDLALADVVLCTHEHADHLDPGAIAAIAGADGPALVVPQPLLGTVVGLGVAATRVTGVLVDRPVDVRGVHIDALPAAHAFHPDPEAFGGYTWWRDDDGRHRAVGYVVELAGIRFFHAGDGVHWPGMEERLRELAVDVGLLPVNGRDWRRERDGLVGNLSGREAADLADAADLRLVIPCHYDGIVGNTVDPAEFVAYLTATYPGRAHHLLDGEDSLLLEPRG